MDDSVGGQFRGKKNRLIQDGHRAEYQPDELTDTGDLISATRERSPDCHRIATW